MRHGWRIAASPPGSGAKARAIHCDADDHSAEVIFRHATGDVSVMMLHGKPPFDGGGESYARASVAGMLIVCDSLGRNLEEMFHLLQSLFEEAQRFIVFEVPDVLTQDGMLAPGEAERILQFSPYSQHLFQLDTQGDGLRYEPAGAAQHALASLEDANH
jgi:hypothetical protein